MNREPIGLYIFRFITGLALMAFMAMLYWSSLLIEGDMKGIKQEMTQLRSDMDKIRIDIIKNAATAPTRTAPATSSPSPVANSALSEAGKSQGTELLTTDPFYAVVLPKLLGENFNSSGTFRDSSYGKPENLHPFSGFADASQLIGRCNISVAKMHFGVYETMAPYAGERIEERTNAETGLPEFWVYLRKDLEWEPLEQRFFGNGFELSTDFQKKHPITARDFKFFWDAIMNPYVSEPGAVSWRTYYSDVDAIEIIDDYTFVVRWKGKETTEDGVAAQKIKYTAKQLTGGLRPLAYFLYTRFADGTKILEEDSDPDAYRKSSVWAQNFAQHWAKNIIPSCGPWKFDERTDQRIVLKKNENFFEPLSPLMKAYELTYRPSPDATWQEFKAGNVTATVLQPEKIAEWEKFKNSTMYEEQKSKAFGINTLEYLGQSYTYIGWNLVKPLFSSKKVRQALTMAIDRKRIVTQNLNNLAVQIHGSFFILSDESNPNIQPWPYDPQTARKLLEAEGWEDLDGDGILDKEIDGKRIPFSFRLTYYVKNPVTKSIVEYVSTALKEIGIDCQLDGVDVADLSTKIEDKSFDAYFLAWALGSPPSDPRQLWYSSYAKVKGSSNVVGFSNAEADSIINRLDFEYNRKRRLELYHRFDEIIHEEQPYTFLFTPKVIMLYRETLQNVFIPSQRKDLIPNANVNEPDSSIYWLKEGK